MTDPYSLSAFDIAARLRLKRHPRSWRGDCPACNYSRVFAVKAGRDNRPLVYCANGCDQDALSETLRRVAGAAWQPIEGTHETNLAQARAAKQAAALRLWSGSAPVPGTLAERYLARRGIEYLVSSPALRFRSDCQHPEHGRHPALIALVQDASGKSVAIHRTYLDRATGGKGRIEPTKASLGPVWGGAIRLQEVRPNVPLVIGEGIESSAAAGLLMGWPAWAAISAGNLSRGLELPADVRDVAIAADPDPVGDRSARSAVLRFAAEGRRAQIIRPQAAEDFADVLVRRGADGR